MELFVKFICYKVAASFSPLKAIYAAKCPTTAQQALPGFAEWVTVNERRFAGFVIDVPVYCVSDANGRDLKTVMSSGMQGGDDRSFRGDAADYQKWLSEFIKIMVGKVVLEVGILRHHGLALWCDLFPEARLGGTEVDFMYVERNKEYLRSLNAFSRNSPKVSKFDQLLIERYLVDEWLNNDKPTIVIGVGLHSVDSVLSAATVFLSRMSAIAVYVFQDFTAGTDALKQIDRTHGSECYPSSHFTALLHL